MKLRVSILLGALVFLAGAGRVQTRDGKTLDGDVAFADNAVVVNGAAVPFDAVARVATRYEPEPAAVTASAGAKLPDGWKSQDVGNVKYPGSAACDGKGVFALTASGWGAWGGSDSFQFAYRPLKGDGQIIAKVAKLDQSSGPVVAGVMIRQSIAPDAPMAGACLYPNGEVRLPRRPVATGGREFKTTDELAPAAWVRLTRHGETLTAYRSADGKFWQQTESQKVPLAQDVLVGVCAWTTGNSWVGGATIESVTVVPGTPSVTYFPGADPLAQGIVLRDGNAFPATITAFDPAVGVTFDRDGKEGTLAAEQVARLVFNRVPPDHAAPGDKPGILLANGDFIDGDVLAIKVMPVEWPRPAQLKATVRSLLFGARSFETAREVVAIDLTPVTPAPAAYEVRTADHALIRAKTVNVTKDGMLVDGVAVKDVVAVRRL